MTPRSLYKKFNLKEHRNHHSIVTRGGGRVKILAVLENVPAPVVVDIYGRTENYYADGKFNPPYEDDMDLFVCDFHTSIHW